MAIRAHAWIEDFPNEIEAPLELGEFMPAIRRSSLMVTFPRSHSDLEAGNMLAKSLSFMAQADAAGIVLGARVPIILTSRADSVITRLASCAVAALVANARREAAGKAVS